MRSSHHMDFMDLLRKIIGVLVKREVHFQRLVARVNLALVYSLGRYLVFKTLVISTKAEFAQEGIFFALQLFA